MSVTLIIFNWKIDLLIARQVMLQVNSEKNDNLLNVIGAIN